MQKRNESSAAINFGLPIRHCDSLRCAMIIGSWERSLFNNNSVENQWFLLNLNENSKCWAVPLSVCSGLGADARIISGNTQSRQLNMVAYTPTNVYHWHNQCARPYHIQSSLSHKLELMPPKEFVAWFVDFEFYLINITGFLVGAKLPENWTKMAGDADVHSFV